MENNNQKNILILGSGAFGTALANNFCQNFKNVYIYGINENEINDINLNHSNENYFKNVILKNNISASTEIKDFINDVDYIVIALPTNVIKNVLETNILPFLNKKVFWLNASKGFEEDINILDDYLDYIIPENKTLGNYKIIGATFANELVVNQPSLLTLTSKKSKINNEIINLLSCKTLKIEWSSNFELLNIFSIFKNIYAIFQGMIDGFNYEQNTKSFFLIESLKELINIFYQLNNSKISLKVEDILNSASLGDYFLTNSSPKSRNYQFGKSLVLNKNTDFLKNNTVEGFNSIMCFKNSYFHIISNNKIVKYILNSIENPKNIDNIDVLIN